MRTARSKKVVNVVCWWWWNCVFFFVKRHTIQEEGFQHGVQQQEQQLYASGTLCNQERSRLNVFEFDPFCNFSSSEKD